MQVLRVHNTQAQHLDWNHDGVTFWESRLRLYSCQARFQIHRPRWSVATTRTRSCVTRSRNYNDAWQLREVDPLSKDPNGCAVVIGAGVAGLASALGLAKWGMSVQVYDRNNIDALPGPETCKVDLSPNTLLALRSLGCNLTGERFKSGVLCTGEVRGIDSVYGSPQAAFLPRLQCFTTYGRLKNFLRSEIDRIAPGRVTFYGHHVLLGHENINVAHQTLSLDGPDGTRSVRYDLLVGADGVRSEVRKVMVKSDRSMKSEYGFVGPLRYVTATKLEVPGSWPSPQWEQVMQPGNDVTSVQEDPYALMEFQGRKATLVSPIEVVGWPKPEWGDRKYYNITLLLFQDPDSDGYYCGTIQGTPALFSELDEILEQKGGSELRATLEELFGFGLPEQWVDSLARAIMKQPIGYSLGGNVLVSKISTPDSAPAITIVGDAAHATTWRLGYSMETALDSAVALADSMFKSTSLKDALSSLNNARLKEISALVKLDKVAPAFSGEEVPMGPLKTIIRTAIFIRIQLKKILTAVGLAKLAPYSTYQVALQAGMSFQTVYKRILRETALVTSACFAILFGFVSYFLSVYNANKYLFV